MVRSGNLVILLTVLMFVVGCGMAARNAAVTTENAPGEDLDPFRYSDEFATKDRSKYSADTMAPSNSSPSTTRDTANKESGDGENLNSETPLDPAAAVPGSLYRIQIGVSKKKAEMEALTERARTRLNIPVYITFKAPFFRVQVGDFATEDEANRQVKILKQIGYRNALRVMPEIY